LEPYNNQAFCGGPVTIAPPVITDTDGDQAVTAGDLLQLRIVTSNETDSSLGYPCLGLAVEGQAALLPLSPAGDALENPIFSGSYALVSGSSVEYEFYARIADSVAPGTTIRFLAWNDALHSQCENSGELEFQIEIE